MGRITIHELTVRAVIGTLPHEREAAQSIRVSIEAEVDTATPAESDDLNQALDYRLLAEFVRELAVEGRFQLIETLAERAARGILEAYPVSRAVVTVRKPNAIQQAEWVEVRVEAC